MCEQVLIRHEREKKKNTLGSQVKYNPFPSFPLSQVPRANIRRRLFPQKRCVRWGRKRNLFRSPPLFSCSFSSYVFYRHAKSAFSRKRGGENVGKPKGGDFHPCFFPCTYVKQSPLAKPFARKRGAAAHMGKGGEGGRDAPP